nr:hypothetical protein [Tanacetum cinerariifolium]
MVNIIPHDHVDEVLVVEPNQHDDVFVVPKRVLVNEDEDPEEDEFEEEEDPQEKEDDMEIDIEEDENEPKLTYPYKEMEPLNPPPPAFEPELDDEIEVENQIEHEDKTIPASVYEMAHALVEKKGKEKDKFYGKLILELGNEMRSSVEQRTAEMEKLVKKLGNTEDKVECKKLKKKLKKARFSNTFIHMQNERVERDLYWTRVQAHEFYQEMIHRGFMFEERPNEAINVPIEDEKIYIFAGFMKCNLVVLRGVKGAIKLRRWFENTQSVFEISKCAEGKKVKFAAATLEGPALTWWKTNVSTMGLETVNQMS